jgi:hypothetical protein
MAYELSLPEDYRPPPPSIRKKPQSTAKAKRPLTVNIGMISGNGFLLNTRQPDVEVFAISIDGLDRMI